MATVSQYASMAWIASENAWSSLGLRMYPLAQHIALMDDRWRIIQAQDNDRDRVQGRVTLEHGDEAEPRLARQLDQGHNEMRARAWGWRSASRLSSGTVGGCGWSLRATKARHYFLTLPTPGALQVMAKCYSGRTHEQLGPRGDSLANAVPLLSLCPSILHPLLGIAWRSFSSFSTNC
jgi:hypothetical protein